MSVLEITRSAHEDVERLENLIVYELQNQQSADKLLLNHRVRNMIDTIRKTTYRLAELYEDKDNLMKDEIAALGGPSAFDEFYSRLKELDKRRATAVPVVAADAYEFEASLVKFSGEEANGKYLDLHELYHQYINSNFGDSTLRYTEFLDVFSKPRGKDSRQYRQYLKRLLEYLVNFMQRTQPLRDLDRVFSEIMGDFEEQWKNANAHHNDQLDFCSSSIEELMGVGVEKLKQVLFSLGLKTGGTIRQQAERLFHASKKPNKKYFAKRNSKEVSYMEAKIVKLCDMLNETIINTKENAERKQAITYYEMEIEREEESLKAQTESDNDDQNISIPNPLKLPMGWDGKAIPFWLYKLHGLKHEFKCEICGDHTYRGRRDFELHFKKFRHQQGLRCLHIPYTKDFDEITSINEAKELWKKIQKNKRVITWCPDEGEEYEDLDGNIYNKKTFSDLQRQGLL